MKTTARGRAPGLGRTLSSPLPPRPRQALPRTGKPEQAQEHLTTATTMYCEMGMTYWLEKAERESKRVWMRVCAESFKE